jgi:uncharacterized membrane protein YhfC
MKLSHLILARIIFTQISSLFFLLGATLALIKPNSQFTLVSYMSCAIFFVFSSLIEIPIHILSQDTLEYTRSNRISV